MYYTIILSYIILDTSYNNNIILYIIYEILAYYYYYYQYQYQECKTLSRVTRIEIEIGIMRL
jgi:hypothetical protein